MIQPEGWPRKFLLQLLSDLLLLFKNRNNSAVLDKIFLIIYFFEKLNYITAFFAVYLFYLLLFKAFIIT